MKRALFLILFALTVTVANAQSFYFGPRGGMNLSSFTRTSDAKTVVRGNVGLFAGVQFSTIAALQLEAVYSFQGTKVNDVKFNTDYIKIPVLAKIYLIKGLNVEAGVSFNILTSAILDGTVVKDFNKFDFSIPVGLAYQFGRHIELGVRYDISTVKVNPNTTGANSNLSVNLAWRF